MNNLGMNQNMGMMPGQGNGMTVQPGINHPAGNPQNMMMPNLPPNLNQLMSQNQHQQMAQNQQQQQQQMAQNQHQQQFLRSVAQNMPQQIQNSNMMPHQQSRSQSLPGNSVGLPQQMLPNRQNGAQRSSSMTGMGSSGMGLGGFNNNSGMTQGFSPNNNMTSPSHNHLLQFQMMQQQQQQQQQQTQMGNNSQQQMQLSSPQQPDQQNFQQTQNQQLMMQNQKTQNQLMMQSQISQQQQMQMADNSLNMNMNMNMNHAQNNDSMNGNVQNKKRRMSNAAVQQQHQLASMKMKQQQQQQMTMFLQMTQAQAQQNMSKQRQQGALRQTNPQSQQLHRQQSSGAGNNSRVSSSRSVNSIASSGDSGNSVPQSVQPQSMQGMMGGNARMLQQNMLSGMQAGLPNNMNKMVGGPGGMNGNLPGVASRMNNNVNGMVNLQRMSNNPQGGVSGMNNNGLSLPSPPKSFGMNKNNNMANNMRMNMNMGVNGNLGGMAKGQGVQQGRSNSGMDMMAAQQQLQALQQQQQMQQAVQQQPSQQQQQKQQQQQQQIQAIQQVIQQQKAQSSRPMQGLPPPKMIRRPSQMMSADSSGDQTNKRRRQNVIIPTVERRGSNVSLPGAMTAGIQGVNNIGTSSGTNDNDRIDSVSPLFHQVHKMNQNQNQNQRLLPPPQARGQSLKRMEKRSSLPLSRDPNPHHNLMHAKDAKPLINSLPCKEKLIYLSRHVMGGRKGNGYFRTISTLNNLRKKLLSESDAHGNKRSMMRRGGMGGLPKQNYDLMDETEAAFFPDRFAPGIVNPTEELKLLEKSPEIASSMITEMGLGLTFCNTISSTIESILSELDPQDKDTRGRKISKPIKSVSAMMKPSSHPKEIKPDPLFPDIEPIAIQGSSVDQEKIKAMAQMQARFQMQIPLQSKAQNQQQIQVNSPQKIQAPLANTISPPNNKSPLAPHNSALRKERDKKMGIKKRKDPIDACAPANPDAKKLSKKELAYRHLNLTRFRKLHRGEYVAVKVPNEDVCTVARVMIDWTGPVVSPTELMTLTDSKRDSLFSSMVPVTDVKYHIDDFSNVKMVKRQLVLPLPQNPEQGNEWLYRCRKGFKVYAMYPQTNLFYPGTVVDNNTYCQGEDNICVVDFDMENVDKKTGAAIQRHVPATFVTLIPREFLPSKAKRRRSSLVGRRGSDSGSTGQAQSKSSAGNMFQATKTASTLQTHPLPIQNTQRSTIPAQNTQKQATMMQPMHQPPILRTSTDDNEQNDDDKTLMDMLDKMPLGGDMGGLDDLDSLDFGEDFVSGGNSGRNRSGHATDMSIFQQMASQTHEL